MNTYTFTKIKRDSNNDNLYNIFENTIIDADTILFESVVMENETGRLDLVSKRIYGNYNYVEELMMINNILNPFSIKEGDIIYWSNEIYKYQTEETEEQDNEKNINKTSKVDPKREKGVAPNIAPKGYKSILIEDNKLKLNENI